MSATSSETLPLGWTPDELPTVLSEYLSKPNVKYVLEVGSFLGRSTVLLAKARPTTAKIHIDTCDVHFKNSKHFKSFYSQIYAKSIGIPDLHKKYFGKSQTELMNNIDSTKNINCYQGSLSDLVQAGLLRKKYDVIYCDVTHDLAEINYNIPLIIKLMATDAILICNNIIEPEHSQAIMALGGFQKVRLVGQLGIFWGRN
jgi:predicted O-methyltransferase YrrM